MKSKATAGRKPAHSEGITTEAGHASLKTGALGANWFLAYPRSLCEYRKGEEFNHETRVWECILFHVLRHEGDPTATYAQVAGEIRPDGSETGIKNGRRRGELRPMSQADICIILGLHKKEVSRAVQKLVKEGVLRQEGRTKIHLVGNPDPEVRSTGGTKVAYFGYSAPFQPPPSHPQKEEWLARLSQLNQQVAATYNTGLQQLRATKKTDTLKGSADIAASYLGIKAADLILTMEQAQESREEGPGPSPKVACTGYSGPQAVPGTGDSQAGPVPSTGDHIREIQKEGESARAFFQKPPAGGQAGPSGVTEQGESQPASQQGSFQINKGQRADRQTDPQNLEEFRTEINRRFTCRFAVPVTRQWAAEILNRLKGADWQQLFDLLTRQKHIYSWAGVVRLADECAATQDTWRAAESTTAEPVKSRREQKAEQYERQRHGEQHLPSKRT